MRVVIAQLVRTVSTVVYLVAAMLSPLVQAAVSRVGADCMLTTFELEA